MNTAVPALDASISARNAGSSFSEEDEKLSKEDLSPAPLPFGVSIEERKKLPWWKSQPPTELDSIATQRSVFDDPILAPASAPHPEYEGIKHFDPSFRWTLREEKKALRILDLRVTGWLMCCFFALHMDTSNIGSAVSGGILKDLHLNTNDFNLGNTLFAVGFLLAEIPSQLVSKKLGPDIWIPTQICGWSVVALCQYWLSGRKSFLATRFILGAAQGGFLCDAVLYFSYFYTKYELPLRLSFFWAFARICSCVMGLIAIGLLKLDGVRGVEGWRYLFLIEGCITFTIGAVGFLMFVPSPVQTKRFPWRNGWFTDHQEKIIVNKILRDEPSKGFMHNRQGLSLRMFWDALCDVDLWPLYGFGMLVGIPSSPISTYLTYTLKITLGFSVTTTNLLTIPPNILSFITTVGLAWISEKINSRWVAASLENIWNLPLLITLFIRPVTDLGGWSAYAVSLLLVSAPGTVPLIVAWISRNSGSVRTRTVSASVYNIILHFQSLASNNIYREDDSPAYRRGNRTLIIICVVTIIYPTLCRFYYKFRNDQKEKKWSQLSPEEKDAYPAKGREQGAKRLDFRFVY